MMVDIERMKKWKVDCYNPLSTKSSTQKLKEAYEIISAVISNHEAGTQLTPKSRKLKNGT